MNIEVKNMDAQEDIFLTDLKILKDLTADLHGSREKLDALSGNQRMQAERYLQDFRYDLVKAGEKMNDLRRFLNL